MKEYESIVKSIMVKPIGEPIFSVQATEVYLDDEAAGPFVVVMQRPDSGEQKISICPEEWPKIKDAIDTMMRVVTILDGHDKDSGGAFKEVAEVM